MSEHDICMSALLHVMCHTWTVLTRINNGVLVL